MIVAGESGLRRRLELPRREMRDGSRIDVLDWTEDSDPAPCRVRVLCRRACVPGK